MSQLQELLTTALNCGASDVHIMVGSPPLLRIHTVLQETDFPVVTPEGAEGITRELLSEHRVQQFMEKRDLDFSELSSDRITSSHLGQLVVGQ